MKYILLFTFLLTINLAFGQAASKNNKLNINSTYDKVLAEKLGGDEDGIRSYFLVILKTGPNNNQNQNFIAEIFKGHIKNVNHLIEIGKLVIAGPLSSNTKEYRGMFILNNIKTLEQAKELLQTDPAIKNELFTYEIFTWFGSAALLEYLPFSKRIIKSKT